MDKLKSYYATQLTLTKMELHQLRVKNGKLATSVEFYSKALPIAFFVGFALAMLLNWLSPLKS